MKVVEIGSLVLPSAPAPGGPSGPRWIVPRILPTRLDGPFIGREQTLVEAKQRLLDQGKCYFFDTHFESLQQLPAALQLLIRLASFRAFEASEAVLCADLQGSDSFLAPDKLVARPDRRDRIGPPGTAPAAGAHGQGSRVGRIAG